MLIQAKSVLALLAGLFARCLLQSTDPLQTSVECSKQASIMSISRFYTAPSKSFRHLRLREGRLAHLGLSGFPFLRCYQHFQETHALMLVWSQSRHRQISAVLRRHIPEARNIDTGHATDTTNQAKQAKVLWQNCRSSCCCGQGFYRFPVVTINLPRKLIPHELKLRKARLRRSRRNLDRKGLSQGTAQCYLLKHLMQERPCT